jgi:hypothetical protein
MYGLHEADDVTDDMLCDVEHCYDTWFADEPSIDWDHFLDRLCEDYGWSYAVIDDDSPAVERIKLHVWSLVY